MVKKGCNGNKSRMLSECMSHNIKNLHAECQIFLNRRVYLLSMSAASFISSREHIRTVSLRPTQYTCTYVGAHQHGMKPFEIKYIAITSAS